MKTGTFLKYGGKGEIHRIPVISWKPKRFLICVYKDAKLTVWENSINVQVSYDTLFITMLHCTLTLWCFGIQNTLVY